MFFHKDVGLVNHFRLEDLENMLPWEREVYMSLMSEKIKESLKDK